MVFRSSVYGSVTFTLYLNGKCHVNIYLWMLTPSLRFYLNTSKTHTHTHTPHTHTPHTHTYTHTHTTHTHHSLSHTHTHTHSLSLSHTHTHTHTLSLSLTHTHTHTHTQTNTHTLSLNFCNKAPEKLQHFLLLRSLYVILTLWGMVTWLSQYL